MGRTIALLVLAACSDSGSQKQEAQPAKPEVVAPKPPPPAPPAKPLPRKALELKRGAVYAKTTATTKVLALRDRGHGFDFEHSDPEHGRIVVGAMDKSREVVDWVLYDIATDKQLATFDQRPGRGVRDAVVVSRNGKPGILTLSDGKIVEPQITLPGSTVAEYRIELAQNADVTWVFARSANGKTFHGAWDRSKPELALAAELAFWPTMIGTASWFEVYTETPVDGCPRYSIKPGAAPSCIPDEAIGATLLGDRYYLTGDAKILDAKTKQSQPIIADCDRPNTRVVIANPPAALVECATETKVQLGLWHPDATFVWDEPGPKFELANDLSQMKEPVVALVELAPKPDFMEEQAARWLDLERAVLYTAPMLVPVELQMPFGFARHSIASTPDKSAELWHLDFEHGTLEKIADDVKCTHTLELADERGERMMIQCISRQGTIADRGVWTEIIDFKARTRTRIDNVSGQLLSEHGALAVQGGQIVSEGSYARKAPPARLVKIETKR
jgi:hypothetical protein